MLQVKPADPFAIGIITKSCHVNPDPDYPPFSRVIGIDVHFIIFQVLVFIGDYRPCVIPVVFCFDQIGHDLGPVVIKMDFQLLQAGQHNSVHPCLPTFCDLQIKRFNDEAAAMSKDIVILFISMDLPFAQKRFCQAYDIKKVKTFSDHKGADFGEKYGVLIKELRLLSRSIFILDKDNKVRYVEYVSELTSHPDYDGALAALKEIV